jgi:phosphatidylethanolamine/phosphatidyl-N-methylethanolamine N-methyltransferase
VGADQRFNRHLRALKPGGRAVILDNFLPEGKDPSLVRKFFNIFSTLLGTDINRRLGDLMKNCSCEVTHDEPSIAGGVDRVAMLKQVLQSRQKILTADYHLP